MIYENSTYELEEMKQQMALLKKKLEQQKIVNESVLRSAMKKKLYGLNKRVRVIFIVGIFVAIWAPGYFTILGFSPLFCAATAVMLLFSAFKTFQYHRKLWRLNFSQSNLIELSEQLTLLRKRYKEWYKIAWCMIIPWFIWIIYEAYSIYGEESVWFLGGSAVGVIIGGLVGTRINNNIIRRADELLEQIDEYKKMQE
ncbi:MAG: hypothetical protein IKK19_05960 [Bacteroidales bacterium]|nr:hypothetical protein [Bacteroidales bacterium]